jgi:sugar phosphate isomerase/epimerase
MRSGWRSASLNCARGACGKAVAPRDRRTTRPSHHATVSPRDRGSMMVGEMTRRQALPLFSSPLLAASREPSQSAWPICMFSKHFHWTSISQMADHCAQMGFDGIDLTLRPGGHIEPEAVNEELPKAVALIRKAGLLAPMVTSHIVDPQTPHAERVMRALKQAGIRRYRWDGFKYDAKRPLPTQLKEIKPRVRDLAAMNKQYGLCAMYHTHSGVNRVGASIWDLYSLIEDLSPEQVSVNLDAGHITAEGGFGGWIHSTRLMAPHTRGIALKDFAWKKDAKGWRPGWCGFGQGMVDFKQYLTMLKTAGFAGPVQLHYEYPELGGADTGKKEISMPKERVLEIFRRDLAACRAVFREVGIV